jgi:hypothetical protein
MEVLASRSSRSTSVERPRPWYRTLGGLHSQFGRFGDDKNALTLPGSKHRYFDLPKLQKYKKRHESVLMCVTLRWIERRQ